MIPAPPDSPDAVPTGGFEALSRDQLHLARILATQCLCQFDVQGDTFADQLGPFVDSALAARRAQGQRHATPPVAALAEAMACGAWRVRPAADDRINAAATDWTVERMALVDRNILRLGVYELLERPATPPKVVIDQAVELAHAFGDGQSPAFVNGVLDAVWRALRRETGGDACDGGPATLSGDGLGG